MKAIAFLFACLAALGQTPSGAGAAGPVALVRFQVEPRDGTPVTGLRPEDIEVREDGAPRKIIALESGAGKQHEIPIEISILLDCDRLSLSSGALNPRLFHEGLLDEFPNASIAVYGFAPGLTRLAAPTRNAADLAKSLEAPLRVHPLSTFLMDHISRVMLEAASNPAAAVRILTVVSSGQTDQGSSSDSDHQRRYERAVTIAQRANVSVFPAVLISRLATQDSTPPEAPLTAASKTPGPQFTMTSGMPASTVARGLGNFGNLGPVTGGHKVELVASGNMLATLVKSIADQIRSEYVVGFQVSVSGTQKSHKIEVIMRNKDRGHITTGALRLAY